MNNPVRRGRPPKTTVQPEIEEQYLLPAHKPSFMKQDEPETAAELIEETKPEPEIIPEPKAEPTTAFSDRSGQKFNILDEDFSDAFFKEPTIPFEETETVEESSSESWANAIPIEEKKPVFKAEDLTQISEFGIELIDSLFSLGISKFAQEGKPKEYEMEKDKKKMLAKQLSLILEKRNVGGGMSLEVMFVITFIIAYVPAMTLAYERRKEATKENADESGELNISYGGKRRTRN